MLDALLDGRMELLLMGMKIVDWMTEVMVEVKLVTLVWVLLPLTCVDVKGQTVVK